jgi:hypothetical protein
MGEPIRTLYQGRQAAAGTAALDSNMKNMYFEGDAAHTPQFARIIPSLNSGAVIQDVFSIPAQKHSVVTANYPLMFDQAGYWLTHLLGPPVTTAVSGATGAYQHVFKVGPSTAPPLATLQTYDGVMWEQMIDAAANTGNLQFSATTLPMCAVNWIAKAATPISAPTPIASSVAAYNHPVGPRLIAVLVAGSSYSDLISGRFNINNARTPFWTATTTADMKRAKRGHATVEFDITADLEAYAGSFYEDFVEGTSPGAIAVSWIDTATAIGTGTPTTPMIRIDVPKPGLLTGNKPNDGPEVAQHITGRALLDSTSATSLYVTLRNEIVTYELP